jgi:hypothetical protein
MPNPFFPEIAKKEDLMRGQWVAPYTGTNSGTIIINIDELDDHFEGHAILHGNEMAAPIVVAKIRTEGKALTGPINVISLFYLDPRNHKGFSKEELKELFPERSFSESATGQYSLEGDFLNVDWNTSMGGSGHASIIASKSKTPSELGAPLKTWNEFKLFADSQKYRKTVFRGQEQPWRLRTAFHRSNRFDLGRFVDEDLPRLFNALAGRTRHFYNLNDPKENASFLHLAQHHGYPTPLLDWTFSPYVAAFCAFRKVTKPFPEAPNVRIFMFDHVQWMNDWVPVLNWASPTLHVSAIEILTIDNERAGPQQALSLLTNLDDPETYIRVKEIAQGKTYLSAVDIQASEREVAMVDLARMGISAGSMFPGIDGACEELKERMFPHR